jgi:molecular chaperone DnaK
MNTSVLGIDLGTTNSVVATIDETGEVVAIRNAVGEETTPSVVYFETDGDVIVGDEAKRLGALDPDNGVILVKRHMGTEYPISIRGQAHTPESISALILRQLVASAGPEGKPRAVITVPAYFGMRQREATAQAARIAGLDVMELVDEPVAAAVHYGLTKPGNRTVLVYDLGGGTFDTTVLKITGDHVTVVATDGHSKLGGADVDERLQAVVLKQLEGLIPSDDYDEFVYDEAKLGSLMADVENAKHQLSSRIEVQLLVNTTAGRITVTLSRKELEDACFDLFAATTEIIERVLAKATEKGVAGIDEAIMVGGSSRIPALSVGLERLLGVTPRLVDPDLAVAKGAALRAHQIAGSSQLQILNTNRGFLTTSGRGTNESGAIGPGTVTPVLPRAVGLLIDDSHDPAGQRQFVAHLIDANTELPAEKTTSSYGTILPRQESVRIQIYEQAGSSPSEDLEHNHRVLDGELTGIGELPAGSVIDVTIKVAIDGRLTVIAREPISGKGLTLQAFMEGVVDSAEVEDLSNRVGLLVVRG